MAKRKVWLVTQEDGDVEGRFSSEKLAWEFLGKAKMAGEWWANSGKVEIEQPPPYLELDARANEQVVLAFHRCIMLDDGSITEDHGGARPTLRKPPNSVWLEQDEFRAPVYGGRPAIRVKGKTLKAIFRFAEAYRKKWLKKQTVKP